jgi:hypothetical protein
MQAPATPPVSPWHRRVLGWLGVDTNNSGAAARLPDPEQRFPWEPVPPAPRPPQWGAADRPEVLLGSAYQAECSAPALGPRADAGAATAGPPAGRAPHP